MVIKRHSPRGTYVRPLPKVVKHCYTCGKAPYRNPSEVAPVLEPPDWEIKIKYFKKLKVKEEEGKGKKGRKIN